MSIQEKVAYVRGLLEGLDIDRDSKEGKIYFALTDALASVNEEIETLQAQIDILSDLTEELDEDLGDMEELLLDDDDEDCDCELQVTCPNCSEIVCLEEDDLLDGSILCPDCGATLEFEFDDDDEAEDKD